jgi:outer membrane protein insertion porin family
MRPLAIFAFSFCLAAQVLAAQGSQKKRSPVAPATSAPAVPQPAKHPLETLKFVGNSRISTDKILAASGLTIGQGAEREDFEAARTRLLATGAFESVGFDFQPSKTGTGFDATFELVEVAQMFPFQFEDLPASDEVLRAVVAQQWPIFETEIPATRPVLQRIERALTEALDGQVTVEAHMLATLKGGEPKIIFRLPGERPRISEVRFVGNKEITTAKLAMTFFQVVIGTEFKESLVRALLDKSIRPLYEARGFIRVAFPKIVAEKSIEPGVDAVAVTVTLEEGPEFKLGRVNYAAGIPGGNVRELDRIAALRTGEVADFDDVKKAQDRIVRKYRGMGYLHASVKQDRMVDDEERIVDLLLTVEPGPQFTYGKLMIEGLDIIGEPAIRKMWGDRQGKPFDADEPDAFLKDVREQGLFDNLGKTSSSTKINEEAKTVDVTLTFEGTKANNGKERQSRQPF